MDRQKAVEARGFPYYPQSSDALAWRRCVAAASVCGRGQEALVKWRQKRKTRPGGQPDGSSHMGAWGGWALAPDTASMGRGYRSHKCWSQQGSGTFKSPEIFLTFFAGRFGTEIYCAAGRMLSPGTDLSAVTAAGGSLKARVTAASGWSGTFSTPGATATGAAGAVTTAETAAKASASPAPNRSSRPGAPRSWAVFVRIARTSSGFNAGFRSSIRAARPLTSAAENEVPDVIWYFSSGAGRKMSTPGAATAIWPPRFDAANSLS